MREGSKAIAALVALLLALGLTACGGDGEGDSTAATTAPATSESEQTPPTGEESSRGAADEPEPARGGEASIEDFGSEASGDDRDSIEGSFSGYLNAVAEKDFETACPYLSSIVRQSIEQLVTQALREAGCPAILPKLLTPTASTIAREQVNGEITKVRVEGDRGFVIFRAPGAELYQMTMVEEDGEWKAATVAASVLVPDL